jgi:hypothetical protein
MTQIRHEYQFILVFGIQKSCFLINPIIQLQYQITHFIGGLQMFNFLFGSKKAAEKAERKLASLRKTLKF